MDWDERFIVIKISGQRVKRGGNMYKIKFALRMLAVVFTVLVISNTATADEKPEIFVQMGHSDRVETMVLSEDGRYLVTGSEDKTVKLWDAGSGSEIRTFTWRFDDKYEDIESVGISNDGRYILAGAGEGTVKIWDSISGKEIRSYKKHSSGVQFVRFSANGERVISIGISKLKVWDTFTGKDIKSIDDIVGIGMSPANNYVLSGNTYDPAKNTYTVYDIATLRKVRSFKAKLKSSPNSVAFSQDGKYCLMFDTDFIKEKSTLELWNTVTGKKAYATEMDKTYGI